MDAFAMELMQQVPSFLPTMPSTAAAVKTADQDAYGTADDPFFTLPPPPATAAAVAAAVVDAAAAEAGGSTGSSPALTPAMWALRVLAPRPTPVAVARAPPLDGSNPTVTAGPPPPPPGRFASWRPARRPWL